MPVAPRIAQPDWLTVFDHVGDDEYFRMSAQMELVQHVHLLRTEAPAERHLRLRREFDVTEHEQTIMCEPSLADRGDVGVRQIGSIAQAEDLCAERRVRQAANVEAGCVDGRSIRGNNGVGHDVSARQ